MGEATTYAFGPEPWYLSAVPLALSLAALAAVTAICWRLGRRGVWLWLPSLLLVVATGLWMAMLTGFGQLPDFGPRLLIYLAVASLPAGATIAVWIMLMVLAVVGVARPTPAAPDQSRV